MSLPAISDTHAVSSTNPANSTDMKDGEIQALKAEIARLQRENQTQADQLKTAAPRTPPSSQKPAPPRGTPNNNRPPRTMNMYETPQQEQQSAVARTSEHPLRQEYRELEESSLRWVTTDQPFSRTPGSKGINMCDDVQEDFFRALMNQATFNLPKELRYALAKAQDSVMTMDESIEVLEQSQAVVNKSAADSLVDVRNDHALTQDRLQNKKLYFTNEVCQYKEEIGHKIDTELAIVHLLIKTLSDCIMQANNVLTQNLRPDKQREEAVSKTLNDIRAEYNHFRKMIMPGMAKNFAEGISGRAAELLSLEKGATIHEIIMALVHTLEEALEKGKDTEERLYQHKEEVALMCDTTLQELEQDFEMFGNKVRSKEDDAVAELHNYKEDNTGKIQMNMKVVRDYQDILKEHMEFARKMINKGNDYQMFKQTKEMKNQMVLMYAELSKMRLQYDGIMFQLNSNELDIPLEYLGTLLNAATKTPVDYSPSANKQRTKVRIPDREILTQDEAEQMRTLFKEYDSDNSGSIDVEELRAIWKRVWPWATTDEVNTVANQLLAKVDVDNSGTVDYEEFLKILDLGYGSDAPEWGAFHA